VVQIVVRSTKKTGALSKETFVEEGAGTFGLPYTSRQLEVRKHLQSNQYEYSYHSIVYFAFIASFFVGSYFNRRLQNRHSRHCHVFQEGNLLRRLHIYVTS
jgi:hypothetical protein